MTNKESGFGRDGGKEGLYEYAKPKWQSPLKIDVPDFDLKKFGAAYGGTDGAPVPGSGDAQTRVRNVKRNLCPVLRLFIYSKIVKNEF